MPKKHMLLELISFALVTFLFLGGHSQANQKEKAPALYEEALLLAQQTGSDEVIE